MNEKEKVLQESIQKLCEHYCLHHAIFGKGDNLYKICKDCPTKQICELIAKV